VTARKARVTTLKRTTPQRCYRLGCLEKANVRSNKTDKKGGGTEGHGDQREDGRPPEKRGGQNQPRRKGDRPAPNATRGREAMPTIRGGIIQSEAMYEGGSHRGSGRWTLPPVPLKKKKKFSSVGCCGESRSKRREELEGRIRKRGDRERGVRGRLFREKRFRLRERLLQSPQGFITSSE